MDKINNKGFTLIELLLTVALITITMGVSSNIILSITRSYTKTQSNNELEMNANYLFLKLERELRSAISVDQPVHNLTSATLSFRDKNNIPVSYTVYYPIVSPYAAGYVTRTYNGTGLNITDNNATTGVSVFCKTIPYGNNFVDPCFVVEGTNPQRVTIGMNVAQANSGTCPDVARPEKCAEIDDTIVSRGTY